MTTIEIDRLSLTHKRLTKKEMTATIGGGWTEDLTKVLPIAKEIIGAFNPPPVVAPPPSDAQIAFSISQGLNAQHNANAQQSLNQSLGIYGALYGGG